jgi:hypothetical protein
MQAAPAEAVLRDAEDLLTELLAAGEYDYGVRQDGKGVYRVESESDADEILFVCSEGKARTAYVSTCPETKRQTVEVMDGW